MRIIVLIIFSLLLVSSCGNRVSKNESNGLIYEVKHLGFGSSSDDFVKICNEAGVCYCKDDSSRPTQIPCEFYDTL